MTESPPQIEFANVLGGHGGKATLVVVVDGKRHAWPIDARRIAGLVMSAGEVLWRQEMGLASKDAQNRFTRSEIL